MANFTEDFNAISDGALSSDSNWTDNVNGIQVISGQVRGSSGTSITTATGTSLAADQYAQIEFGNNPLDFDYLGVVVRFSGTSGYVVFLEEGSFQLRRMDSGVLTHLTSVAQAVVAGDIIRLRVEGSLLNVEFSSDGGTSFSTIITDWSDTTYTTGQSGIYYQIGDSNGTLGDNFYTEDTAAGGATLDNVGTANVTASNDQDVSVTTTALGETPTGFRLQTADGTTTFTDFTVLGANSFTADNPIDLDTITSDVSGFCPFSSANHTVNGEVFGGALSGVTRSVTYNPQSGWAIRDTQGAVSGGTTLFRNHTGNIEDGAQIIYPTAKIDVTDSLGNYEILSGVSASFYVLVYWPSTDTLETLYLTDIDTANSGSSSDTVQDSQKKYRASVSGASSSDNDMYRSLLGVTSGALPDLMKKYAETELGITGGSINDLMKKLYDAEAGVDGDTITDLKAKYFKTKSGA